MKSRNVALLATALVWLTACPSEESPPPSIDSRVKDQATDQVKPDVLARDLLATDLPNNLPPAGAVLVSPTGLDGPSCGTSKETACATIAKGIERAKGFQPPRPVALAPGTYNETVTLVSGLQLLGGFNQDFKKLGGGNTTAVIKGSLVSGEAVAVIAENLAAATLVDTIEIEAPAPTDAGKSSYGVIVNNAPQLELRNCTIRAAAAKNGTDGAGTSTAAPNGNGGGSGTGGSQFDLIQPEPIPSCALVTPKGGFPGAGGLAVQNGLVVCGAAGGGGGQAGVDSCSGNNGGTGSLISTPATTCTAATAGAPGKGGAGGLMASCVTSKIGGDGTNGCDGRNGTPGAGGAGGKHRVISGYFVPSDGENGKDGVNDATGGGGGGGGGGGDCSTTCFNCIADNGGGGGGGGSAGCAGKGGGGGTSGGGSFAVFISQSAASITIADCKLFTGNGGNGGNGGAGQPGGQGGAGSSGGAKFQVGGAGGKGGKGGDGAAGGHGGGGAGGPSVGVYVASGTAPTVTNTSFQLGNPGSGGTSSGNAGDNGFQEDVHVAP